MRRRDFIQGIVGPTAAWPLGARAQQPKMPVIGFLGAVSANQWANRLPAFHQGLNETGYVEGRNVLIEYRWAENINDRIPALAADLVRRQVAVIVVPGSTPASLIATAATKIIPIVFETAADPVEVGLVSSLSRPGGNATGLTTQGADLAAKRLELLHELVPKSPVIGFLINPTSQDLTAIQTKAVQAAARARGVEVLVVQASTEREIELAFDTLAQKRVGGVVISADALFTGQREKLGALSARRGMPAIYQWRDFATAGGLMSYGTSITDNFRRVGVYTGRILKGEKPADLPVQLATKIELIINLKTAKALGITVPLPLLGRADEVIE